MTDQTGRTAAPAAKKKKGLSRKTLYMLIALAAAALMMSLAAVIRGANDGREYALYYDQAVSAYDCGDYNTALSYLRKAYAKSETDECVVFMADCYEAQKNYTKALELLTALNSRKSDILSRIAALEEKCGRSEDAGRVTVAGKEYPVNTTGIVLDNMALGDGVLSELSSLYALSNLSAAGNGITSIAPISQLGGLTTLNLSDNSISDISPLSSLSNLRTLYLDNNPVADLSPLCSLSNLTTLSIKGVPVTDRQLAELSSSLPNCAIHSENTEEEMQDIVTQWRQASPTIPKFWRDAEKAAKSALQNPGRTFTLPCGVKYRKDADAMRCRLPSGRVLSYWGARLEDNAIVFMGQNQTTRKWEKTETWGGKLVENIVQAFARDCLAVALLRLDEAGFAPVFHVHDEVICEEPIGGRTWQDVAEIMGQPIDWAPGLLLRGDGYETKFYMKD